MRYKQSLPYSWSRAVYTLVTGVAVGLTALVLTPTVGTAQTVFAWPETQVDVTKYTLLEPCAAMIGRVRDSLRANNDTLFDTLQNGGIFDSLPAYVHTMAQRCLSRFSAEDIPPDKYRFAQRLFLMVGRDADVETLTRRRLAAIAPTDSVQRTAVLDSIIQIYFSVRPVRMEALRPLVDQLGPTGYLLGWQHLLSLYTELIYLSYRAGRETWTTEYGQAYRTIAKTTIDTLKNDPWRIGIARRASVLDRILYDQELMDSLRMSTDAYAKTLIAKTSQTVGALATVVTVSGRPAPELRGDFVFPESAKHDRLPRPGKVSLIVGIDGDQRDKLSWLKLNVSLRRIVRRFPDVDVVFMTKSTGVIAPLAPPSPSEEAEVFYSMIKQLYTLPATLVVANTQFFHVPGHDRRRVNIEMESELYNYKNIVLIDRHGVVVDVYPSEGGDKPDRTKSLMDRIQALSDQDQKQPLNKP